jgi:heterodisulfide reductase subunit B2
MKISYYPGCTLKNAAKNFEDSTLYSLNRLDTEVEELKKWYCCGTVFSLSTDDLIHHVAPIRNLVRVKEAGSDTLMTLCAMCYNTLKRANIRMQKEPENLERINNFMWSEDIDYKADVKVLHMLELLRDEIKLDTVAEKVVKPLKGLKVSTYYGCLLVRPKEVGFDDMENPTILEKLITTLGADPVDSPYKTECCAAYQTVDNPAIVADRTHHILTSARNQGAEVVVVSCPLCAFNLDQRQKETVAKYPDFKHIPVLYFTQLLAIALGSGEEDLGLGLHYIDPLPLLKEKKLL